MASAEKATTFKPLLEKEIEGRRLETDPAAPLCIACSRGES